MKSHSFIKPGLLFIMIAVFTASCLVTNSDVHSFDIPHGPAAKTLLAFAEQANVEIIFNNDSIDVVLTKAIHGKMTSLEALEKMIEGTNLSFMCDDHHQSFAVSNYPET